MKMTSKMTSKMSLDLSFISDIPKQYERDLHALEINHRRSKEQLYDEFRAKWFIYRSVLPVSLVSGIHPNVILSPAKAREIFDARSVVIWIAHRASGATHSVMGRVLNRDHSSIRYAIRHVDESLADRRRNITSTIEDVCMLESQWR